MKKMLKNKKAQKAIFALRNGRAVKPEKVANIISKLLDERRNLTYMLAEIKGALEETIRKRHEVICDQVEEATNAVAEVMDELEELREFKAIFASALEGSNISMETFVNGGYSFIPATADEVEEALENRGGNPICRARNRFIFLHPDHVAAIPETVKP